MNLTRRGFIKTRGLFVLAPAIITSKGFVGSVYAKSVKTIPGGLLHGITDDMISPYPPFYDLFPFRPIPGGLYSYPNPPYPLDEPECHQ